MPITHLVPRASDPAATYFAIVATAHAGATLFMTGVIWFVQVVHYPLMASVGEDGFAAYAKQHARRTAWIVVPPMVIELGSAVALVLYRHRTVPQAWGWIGLALLCLIWVTTAVAQVPAHRTLQRGFDAEVHRTLVWSNWVRTLLWTARAALSLLILAAAFYAVYRSRS